jgi:hypothetical protein
MTLYHGSNTTVKEPRILQSNRTLDFGTGFYTTSNIKQARNFTNSVIKRLGGQRIINKYEFDKQSAFLTLKVLQFKDPDETWLNFVNQNRSGLYKGENYDIITGPVANDKVYRTLVLYSDGTLTLKETLQRLNAFKLYNQIVFKTESALSFLKFITSEIIQEGNHG